MDTLNSVSVPEGMKKREVGSIMVLKTDALTFANKFRRLGFTALGTRSSHTNLRAGC